MSEPRLAALLGDCEPNLPKVRSPVAEHCQPDPSVLSHLSHKGQHTLRIGSMKPPSFSRGTGQTVSHSAPPDSFAIVICPASKAER